METNSGVAMARRGFPDLLLIGSQVPTPIQFVDEGDTIVLFQQEYDLVRTIHMNSDVDPETRPATPLGYSVGRWEDGTLVITTTRIDWPLSDRRGARVGQADCGYRHPRGYILGDI